MEEYSRTVQVSTLPEPCEVPTVLYLSGGEPMCNGNLDHCPYHGSEGICLKQQTMDMDEPGDLGLRPIMFRGKTGDIVVLTNHLFELLPDKDKDGTSAPLRKFLEGIR